MHLLVFVCLVIAATFTAFYTGRQWLLTFWGKPRSAAAEYATLMTHGANDAHLQTVPFHQRWLAVLNDDAAVDEHLRGKHPLVKFFTVYRDSFPMQLPLVILAFFALTAGFVGIHPEFPLFNLLTSENNFFKNFIKDTIIPAPETIDFSLIPVAFSFGAALVGLGAAWVVYGMQPIASRDDKDPVRRSVGDPAWSALQNRFGIDAFYLRALYVPFEWFGRRFTYEEVDKKTIDELLSGVADFATRVGETIKRFNYVVIDGVGDGIPRAVYQFGRWFRNLQTGRVQQYMLFTALALLAMGTLLVIQTL
ncbi:MAG: hypothetical protein HC915_04530 [Anaerolineae bacterium]|nr:hypothetical protein [Anaerolineae bacterium]